MSVLLNIAMPKTCEVCPCNDDNWRCGATGEHFDYEDKYERRRADCPLIEIPAGVRLIDANKMRRSVKFTGGTGDLFKEWIDRQPTVIETEADQ